jgi:hypothetical protein
MFLMYVKIAIIESTSIAKQLLFCPFCHCGRTWGGEAKGKRRGELPVFAKETIVGTP